MNAWMLYREDDLFLSALAQFLFVFLEKQIPHPPIISMMDSLFDINLLTLQPICWYLMS